jgi:hypothetical protein
VEEAGHGLVATAALGQLVALVQGTATANTARPTGVAVHNSPSVRAATASPAVTPSSTLLMTPRAPTMLSISCQSLPRTNPSVRSTSTTSSVGAGRTR